MSEISIVIPVYNKCGYMEEAIGTVLAQTFGDYELLLVDDGSTDGSERICERLAEKDGRIKVFHTSNRGVSAARNLGLRKASGRYICFIDADDRVDKHFLEKLHDAVKKEEADLAVCGYYEFRDRKRVVRSLGRSDTENGLYDVIRYNVLCVLWNKLFVRKKIRHGFDETLSTAEDSIFCVQYYLDNHPKIAYVWEDLYAYGRYGDGLTGSLQKRALSGISRLYFLNRKLMGQITEKGLRALALHHIDKVYFYGIYTFIFENLCSGAMKKDDLTMIGEILSLGRYKRCIRYILLYPLRDRRAEYTTKKEVLYILFSLLKMKRAIWLVAKVKKCLEPFKNHW